MYLIRFGNGNKNLIAAESVSLLAIANILENSKTQFKVYMFNNCVLPSDFASGDYKYWLTDQQSFS